MTHEQESRIKYGDKKTDIISQSLVSSPDFCYYNALKYAQRAVNISKLSYCRRLWFRYVKNKGNAKEEMNKMYVYLTRMGEVYPDIADECAIKCSKTLTEK